MTPIQRRACLSLRGIVLSKFAPWRLRKALIARGESERWRSTELTARQLACLARLVRRYRRQIGDSNLLFWAQRVLAEQQFTSIAEEPCQR